LRRRSLCSSGYHRRHTTLIDLAAGGTAVDLEFAYILSTQSKIVLTAHEVYLPKPKLAVEGPGGVQASFDFRDAKNDTARRMLTIMLHQRSRRHRLRLSGRDGIAREEEPGAQHSAPGSRHLHPQPDCILVGCG
jgi:hypothetical protein